MSRKDEIITILGEMSRTDNHELLLKMMDEYNKTSLSDITEEEAEKFLNKIKKSY